MQNMAAFFIKNFKLTIVISIFLAVFGVMGLSKLKSESFPSVDFAMATIITNYKGASVSDIETKITKPLEDEIRTVSGLKDVRSISQAGFSKIFVRIDMDNIDVSTVMNDLQKAVDRTTGLPPNLEEAPKFQEIKSEEFPVTEIAIVGPNVARERDLLADKLKESIEDNKRVLNVRPVGFLDRRFQIKLDYNKLLKYHIGIDEILNKISLRNISIPGGTLKEGSRQKLIRVEGKISNKDELAKLLIRSNFSGQSIYLKDVADIIDGMVEPKVLTRYNGKEATLLVVNKKGGADTIKLVEGIQDKIDLFKKQNPQFEFYQYLNEAKKVKARLDILSSNAISGLILVVLFLFFFLPGKVGLMASLSLPLAIMGTFGFMYSIGVNLNTVSILALVISIGMLVDNSVVISENFTRLRREGMSSSDAATKSIAQLWAPISATAFTTISAFLPMLVTKGIMGEFIKFIPIIVSVALLLSLFESFFLLPMRLRFIGKNMNKAKDGASDWFVKFERMFERFMDIMVTNRYWVSLGFVCIIILSLLFMVKFNKFILFPADQTEIYIARFETAKGSRIEYTNRVLEELSVSIKKVVGEHINHIVGRVGSVQIGPIDPKSKDGNNVGMITIYVNDYTKFNISHTVMLDKLRSIKNEATVELSFEVMINGPPVGDAINATFRSNNLNELNSVLDKVVKTLSKEKGIHDLKINEVIGDDEVFVNINYASADRLGLSVKSIGDTISAAASGKRISNVTLHNKEVDLMVRMQNIDKKNISDLKKIKIMDSRGNLVPLGSIATFEIAKGTPQITRFDYKRSKTVTGNVDDKFITSFIANRKLQEIFSKLSKNHPGVSLIFGGQEESTKESMQSLKDALILSLIGIFALLVFLFKSYLRPLIIMSTIPLGLLGFSIAFFLHNRPMSFLALIGVIGLGGIIVNSGIVLISFIDNLKKNKELSLHQVLIRASGMRLRAVLVTSLTTISGLLPTAYGIGGSDATLIPMTLAMAWGLTSGTILTLIWVPCAYAILEDWSILIGKILTFQNKSNRDNDIENKNKNKNQLSQVVG